MGHHLDQDKGQEREAGRVENIWSGEQDNYDGWQFWWKLRGGLFGGSLAAGGLVASDPDSNANEGEDGDLTEATSGEPAPKKSLTIERSAPVWNFATKVDATTARCNICKKEYQGAGSNTSNIQEHILSKHKKTKEGQELAELVKKKKIINAEIEGQKKKEQKGIEKFFKVDKVVSKAEKKIIDSAVVEFFITRNEPFRTAEDYFFRKMVFKLNSGYVVMSDKTLRRKVDERIVEIQADLSKEIRDDIKVHKTISMTSDGGNSGDQNKTKKNSITVSRITESFEMKTDTVALPEAVGSQTGPVLRAQWKEELLKIGYDATWRILATTDAASNVRSARSVARHDEIGLAIKYETDCVDHQV